MPKSIRGPCCACRRVRRLRNIILMGWRCPTPGLGWGCLACGLPEDGAIAVVCDDCVRQRRPVVDMCRGSPNSPERCQKPKLLIPFVHDLSRHPELAGGGPPDPQAN